MKRIFKIILIIILIITVTILIDTTQAIILKNSPILSRKEELIDNDSWIDKGLLIDTYHCVKEKDIITVNQKFKTSNFACPVDNVSSEYNETYDKVVMVDGKLYYYTGKESTIEARCGNMDGKITSNINYNEIPTINNQANFDGDYGYQYADDNTIDLYINEKWIVFKAKEQE